MANVCIHMTQFVVKCSMLSGLRYKLTYNVEQKVNNDIKKKKVFCAVSVQYALIMIPG